MSGCDCAECGTAMTTKRVGEPRHEAHGGRGLCEPCYKRVEYRGRLDEFPRTTWSRDDLMSEWEFLREDGYTRRAAAERLGMKWETFDRAFLRAKAAGDPRAVPELSAQWVPAPTLGDAHAMAR